MSTQPNGMWSDTHMHAMPMSDAHTAGAAPSFVSNYPPSSSAYSHSPYVAPSNVDDMHTHHMLGSSAFHHEGGPNRNSFMATTLDSTVGGAPFGQRHAPLERADPLESAMAILHGRMAAGAENKGHSSNTLPHDLAILQQQQLMPLHADNEALPMPWTTLGQSHTAPFPFLAGGVALGPLPIMANGDLTSSPASSTPLNGPGSATMSMLASNGAEPGPSTQPTSLSLPSSPALFHAMNANGHSHGHSPLTNNDVSGSESAKSNRQVASVKGGALQSTPTVGGSTAGTTRRTKFRRSRTGCMVCRKRKVKCDQDGLPCKQCRIGKRDCHYEECQPKRKVKRKANHGGDDGSGSDRPHVSSANGNFSAAGKSESVSPSRASTADSVGADATVLQSSLVDDVVTTAPDGKTLARTTLPFAVAEVEQTSGRSTHEGLQSFSTAAGGPADDDSSSKAPSEHWGSTVPLNAALLSGASGLFDDWTSNTPSTGPTSINTIDGEHLSNGSNISSRRVTLTDEHLGAVDDEAKDAADRPDSFAVFSSAIYDGSSFSWSPNALEGEAQGVVSRHGIESNGKADSASLNA